MTRIIFRRGTAAEWIAANPVLEDGEPGYETDTQKQKIGDGVTAWVNLEYSGLSQEAVVFPVLTVQGDTGDVRLNLASLDGVVLDVPEVEENGTITEPGPTLGEFLGWDENGIARNYPINLDTLGAPQRFEPKDPQSKYRVYGYAIPRGGTQPDDLPDVAWVADENNPEMSLISDIYTVAATSANETLPSYLDYARANLVLSVATTDIAFPPAPTVGEVIYDLSLDQDSTGGRLATWSTNVRWEKIGGTSAPPVLETAPGARNRLRFSGAQGRWECISRVVYEGLAAAAATPTWVGSLTGNNGTSNTSTNVSATYPGVVNANDVCVICFSLSGNTVLPDATAIAALGFTLMEGPITNNDTSPNLRSYLYKKKLSGSEDAATIAFPWTGGNARGIITGGVFRGADFAKVNYVPARGTVQGTSLTYPAITPSVDNTLLAAINSIRYGNLAGTPGVTMTADVTWSEQADHYEGRPTDGSVVQFGGHLATKALSTSAGVVHPQTHETLAVAGTFAGFVVSVPPVDA